MQKVIYKGTVLGIKIDQVSQGSKPITDGKEPVQVVTLKHAKGVELLPHMHEPKVRKTEKLQECIVVRKGKVKLSLYTQKKQLAKSVYLSEGQAFILQNGGVGIKIIDDAEIIEVKNGPFKEDKIMIL